MNLEPQAWFTNIVLLTYIPRPLFCFLFWESISLNCPNWLTLKPIQVPNFVILLHNWFGPQLRFLFIYAFIFVWCVHFYPFYVSLKINLTNNYKIPSKQQLSDMGGRSWELYRHCCSVAVLHRAASCLQESFHSGLVLLSDVSSQWRSGLCPCSFNFTLWITFSVKLSLCLPVSHLLQSDFCHNCLEVEASSFCENFGSLSLSHKCLDQQRPLKNFVDCMP